MLIDERRIKDFDQKVLRELKRVYSLSMDGSAQTLKTIYEMYS